MLVTKECQCCGAVLTFLDKPVVVCVHCGTPNQRPKVEGLMLENFRHAIRQRMKNEFHEAEKSYRFVLNAYPDDAEALWGCMLCHYGAEFLGEEDGRRKYAIHFPRGNEKPMQEQSAFLQACALAEPPIKRRMQQDAAYIDKVNQYIVDMANKKPAFDVFLCHKTTVGEGLGYTEDYNRAYALYNLLTKKGYRVFFAPLEMQAVSGGENYEAGIYHALQTAKVMLVICSDPEWLRSTWVQSEWQRYLEMADVDHTKTLIPLLYGNMRAERLPQAFHHRALQAVTMELDGGKKLLPLIHRCVKPKKKKLRVLAVLVLLLAILVTIGMQWEKLSELWSSGTEVPDEKEVLEGTAIVLPTEGLEATPLVTVPVTAAIASPEITAPLKGSPTPTASLSVTPSPVATRVPTPSPTSIVVTTMNINISYSENTEIATVSWSSVSGAVKYRVKRANGKDSERGAWKTISELNATQYADDAIQGRIYSSYQVEALDRNGNVIGRSAEKSVYAATWSAYGGWTTQKLEETSTRRRKIGTQYRTKMIVGYEPKYGEWGTPGEWVTEALTESNTCRLVDTRVETSSKITYTYSRWRYYNTAEECIWYSYSEYRGDQYGGQGKWQTKELSSRMTRDGSVNGQARFRYAGEPWYNEETNTEITTVTYYQYQTRTVTQAPVYGNPSGWSITKPNETDTVKVESRTVYSYSELK